MMLIYFAGCSPVLESHPRKFGAILLKKGSPIYANKTGSGSKLYILDHFGYLAHINPVFFPSFVCWGKEIIEGWHYKAMEGSWVWEKLTFGLKTSEIGYFFEIFKELKIHSEKNYWTEPPNLFLWRDMYSLTSLQGLFEAFDSTLGQ